ncbi:hypothetical protein [Bartonella sp. DGB2]|uniref:deoxynucleotide monophosphate kinase family protein n=1 Tax=Bartonella sp. DGB2 TaxID=3388426 RepID=UPI0039900A89
METKPRIIALYSSAPQSGKTTIAQHIARCHDYHPASIAAPLKKFINDILTTGYHRESFKNLETYTKEKAIPELSGKSPRVLMQSLGVDWGRNVMGEDFWLNLFLHKYNLLHSKELSSGFLIIDDLRFPNEFEALKERGAVFWKIVRKDAHRPNDHKSEGLLDAYKFNETIQNDEGTEVLCARASERLSQYA